MALAVDEGKWPSLARRVPRLRGDDTKSVVGPHLLELITP